MQVRYGPASTEQVLGALPVVAAVCRRLDIAGIIDRAAPVRDVALATHGQVIVAMIANRLTSPTPMVHLVQWARAFAVEHAFAVAPELVTLSTDGGPATLDVPSGSYALNTDSDGGPQSVRVSADPSASRSLTVTSGGGALELDPTRR